MKKFRKNLSILLIGALLVNAAAVPAFADTNPVGWQHEAYEGDWGTQSTWFYYKEDGSGERYTNCIKTIDGKRYYFDEEGAIATNSLLFLNPGDDDDDSTWYVSAGTYKDDRAVFAYHDGTLAQNTWISVEAFGVHIGPDIDQTDKYYFGADGFAKQNCTFQDDGVTYYLDGKGLMLSNQWLSYTESHGYSPASSYNEESSVNQYYTYYGGILKDKTRCIDSDWYDFDSIGNASPSDASRAESLTDHEVEDITLTKVKGTDINGKSFTLEEEDPDEVTISIGETLTLTYEVETASPSNAKLSNYHEVYAVRDLYNMDTYPYDNANGYHTDLLSNNTYIKSLSIDGNTVTVKYLSDVPGAMTLKLYVDDQYNDIHIISEIPEKGMNAALKKMVPKILARSGDGYEFRRLDALLQMKLSNEVLADLLPDIWLNNTNNVSALESIIARIAGLTLKSPAVSEEAAAMLQGSADSVQAVGIGLNYEAPAAVYLSVDATSEEEYFIDAYSEDYENLAVLDILYNVQENTSSDEDDAATHRTVRLPLVIDMPLPTGITTNGLKVFVHHSTSTGGEELDVTVANGRISFATYALGSIAFVSDPISDTDQNPGVSGDGNNTGDGSYGDSIYNDSNDDDSYSSSVSTFVSSTDTAAGVTTGPGTVTSHGSWQQDAYGWRYRFSNGSYPAYTWGRIDNQWYYFGGGGYMLTGWYYDKELQHWFYMNESGEMLTGWQLIDGVWYYLNPISDGTKGAKLTNQWIGEYFVDANGAWVPDKKH